MQNETVPFVPSSYSKLVVQPFIIIGVCEGVLFQD